jgi:hypothetical protein
MHTHTHCTHALHSRNDAQTQLADKVAKAIADSAVLVSTAPPLRAEQFRARAPPAHAAARAVSNTDLSSMPMTGTSTPITQTVLEAAGANFLRKHVKSRAAHNLASSDLYACTLPHNTPNRAAFATRRYDEAAIGGDMRAPTRRRNPSQHLDRPYDHCG